MLKRGDKVVCIDNSGAAEAMLDVGKKYVLREDHNDGDGWRIEGFRDHYFRVNRFKAVEAIMPLADNVIRVGSVLRCIEAYRPAALRNGQEVVVKSLHGNLVKLEEYPNSKFRLSRFVLANGAQAVEKEIAVGDMVYFNIPDGRGGYNARDQHAGDGVKYEVVKMQTNGSEPVVQIRIGGQYAYWVSVRCVSFTKGKPAPKPKEQEKAQDYKEGDFVLVTSDSKEQYHKPDKALINDGQIYQINNLIASGFGSNSHAYRISDMDGKDMGFYTDKYRLSPVPADQVEELKAKAAIIKAEKAKKEAEELAIQEAKEVKEAAEWIEKAKKIDIRSVLKKKADKFDKDDWRNSAFAYIRRGQQPFVDLDAACYAQLDGEKDTKPMLKLAISFEPAFHTFDVDRDLFKLFLNYQLNDSPWKDCYINKDVEDVLENCLEINTDLPLSQIVGACIATREGYEKGGWLPTFKHFIDKGYQGNVARMMCMGVSLAGVGFSRHKWSTGHTAINSGISAEAMLNFFVHGYKDIGARPANVCKKRYAIEKAVIAGFKGIDTDSWFMNNIHTTKVGEGFKATTCIDKASVYALADKIQQMIDKKEVAL